MSIDKFIYRSSYKSLNLKNNIFSNLDKSNLQLKKDFYKDGIVAVDYKSISEEMVINQFYQSTDLLGAYPAVDANRRKKYKFNNNNKETLASVDAGNLSINPHAEASFSPIRPSIIAFLCLDISPKARVSGLTTLIDGQSVWEELETSTKELLQSLNIKYSLEIDLDIKKNIKGKIIPYFLNYVNVSDVYLNTKEAKLGLNYNISFLREHPISRKISIANHAFVPLDQESQIKNREFFINGKPFFFSQSLLNDIFDKIHKYTFTFKWNKGKSIILDNYRFMHGRLGYSSTEKRKIIIRQLKNFKI